MMVVEDLLHRTPHFSFGGDDFQGLSSNSMDLVQLVDET